MIKFIASDIDCTIIDKNNFINKNNLEVIDKMISKPNLTFAICTGKSYSVYKNTCKNLKAHFGIFGNGNQIIDLKSGKEIYKIVLNIEDVIKCLNIAKKYNLHTHLYTEDKIITEKLKYMDLRNYILSKNSITNNDLKFEIINDLQKYVNTHKENIFQIVISNDKNLTNIKTELSNNSNLSICHIKKYGIYKDFITNKEYEYLTITPFGVDKSIAIDFLIKYLNINSSDVLTIGDNLNDINMLKNFGVGVGVANCYDEVKRVCKFITKNDVSHGGFAEAIYNFIKF